MTTENLKIGIGFLLICLLWGSTWMAIRIGLESLTPIISAGFRFSLASILIYVIMGYRKIKIQKDKVSVILYLILGLFSFVFPFGLVYWGETIIPSSLASILFATYPLFVVIFSKIAMPEERVYFNQAIGIILGFLGIIVIFSEDISFSASGVSNLMGMLAVVISAMLQGAIAVTIKKFGKHLNPLSMNFIPILIAGILLTISGFLFEDTSTLVFDFKAFASVGYLAFFGTVVTFTTYYWLLKRMSVVLLSLSAFITPIVAVIFGWFFLNEILSPKVILGSSLVLMGILFANFKGLKNYYYTRLKSVSE